jgi:hypothetical protein
MTVLMYLVVSTGLIASVVLLALALVRGRTPPIRRVPWIVALVILGIDTALHVASSVGVVIGAGIEGAWFVLGTLAFLAILVVAVLKPRWAGWTLLVSAAVVPVVFALGGLAAPNAPGPSETEGIPPWPVALVTYSVPAAITGSLLVLSTKARRGRAGEVMDEAVPHAVH